VPPYNYVHHKAVTPETLGAEEKGEQVQVPAGEAV
jgi:hypothetical protein